MAESLDRPAWVLGEGVEAHAEAFRAQGLHVCPPEAWAMRPGVVGLIGEQMALRGEFADPVPLTPIYIRRPEAEEKRMGR